MIRYQAAGRYAKALFKSPCSRDLLEKRAADLEEIERRVDQNPKFCQYLYAPELKISEKKDFVNKVLDDNFDPFLINFLFFLQRKKRLNCLPEITRLYRQLVDQSLGILDIHLITPMPLEQNEKEALKLKISQYYPDKEIAFFEKIDPNIIGGLIIIIGHRIIDLSLKNTLSKMKEQLLAAPV